MADEVTSATTASTAGVEEVSLSKMLRAIQVLELGPRAMWTLVSPDGRVWQTHKVEELFAILAPHHPLLRGAGNFGGHQHG